jgi:hypothetical protein
VAMRVEDVTHLQELQISLKLWGEIGLRQVEPLGTSSRFLFLITKLVEVRRQGACQVRQCGGSVSE